MTKLRMFYRMLGIAENIIDPSFYHLLGIDRKDCNSATVKAALLARKNELRQNAPGREFVPQIIEFEKEYLEPAASVLADDVKRAKYDKVIASRWQKIRHETEKRARLVGAVRLAITNAIDSHGALSKSGRDALGKELKSLGVEEHNVEAILARIPAPLFETGEHDAISAEFFHDSVGLAAGKGGLDEKDKTKLFELADRLKIDKDKAGAAIDEAMSEDGFRIQKRYLEDEGTTGENEVSETEESGEQGGDAEKIHLVNDVLDDEGQVEEVEEALEESEEAYEALRRRWQAAEESSGSAFKYIAIVVGLIVIGGLVYLLINKGGVEAEKEEPGGGNGVKVTTKDPGSETSGGDNLVDPLDELIDDPGDMEDPEEGSGNGEVRQVTGQLSDAAKFLLIKDFTALDEEELLYDTVIAMAASCARTSVLAWQSHLWNAELNEMLEAFNAADVIAKRVVFVDADGQTDIEASLDDDVYEQLENDLASADKHVRYFAIERLANIGSRRAVELLLGKPVSGMSGGRQMISRRFRALTRINKPYIAFELAKRIASSSRGTTAHYICLGLIDMTGITPVREGVLAAKNEPIDREACATWWTEALKDWKGNEDLAVEPVVDEGLNAEICRPAKLASGAAFYCNAAAGEIAFIGSGIESSSERQKPATGPMGKIMGEWDNEFALAAAAAKLNGHLEKALRKLDLDEQFFEEIALIKSADRLRMLSAKTGFQKAAAKIETTGQLLELVVRLYYPDGRFEAEIEKIGSDRRADIKRVTNVLQGIRQHAMYNLRLFDLLEQQIDSAAVFEEEVDEISTVKGAGGLVLSIKELKLRKEKMQAFGELAVGLEAYLTGRLYIAGKYIEDSLEYGGGKYVRGVFHSKYSGLLDAVIADCNSGAEFVCKVCGGTEVVDCSSCSGMGWNVCRECKGTGLPEGSRVGRRAFCTSCGGLGAVRCNKCEGKGIVECTEKDDGGSGHGERAVFRADRDAVMRMLAIALYLEKGGADVYSKGAISD